MLSRVPTPTPPLTDTSPQIPDEDDGNLTDLQAEMWILLPVAQTLTAFLVLIPFTGGFAELEGDWRKATGDRCLSSPLGARCSA
jgi:hypothetical protein